MSKQHHYHVTTKWTGNKGAGTTSQTAYARDHVFQIDGKPDVPGSSDPAFRGDEHRYNPEELLVMAVSACHMLWYLSLCARADVVVTGYEDAAEGSMEESDNGGGHFTSVVLKPVITLQDISQQVLAEQQHRLAHEHCFIAQSVNFPVTVEATYLAAP